MNISLQHGSTSLEADISSTLLEYLGEPTVAMGKGNRYQGCGVGRGHPHQNNYGGNSNAALTTQWRRKGPLRRASRRCSLPLLIRRTRNSSRKKTTLSWYISTKAWRGSRLASQYMYKMTDWTIAKPVKPEKVKIEPSNPEYAMECSDYMV